MALFEYTNQGLVQVPEARFDSEVLKSKDLQRLLRQDISVLSGDLKVLAEDYGNWEDGNARIDLLCLDKEANLVIVQIKSTADPGYLDLQAIRCAAMISAMTFEEAVAAAARDPIVRLLRSRKSVRRSWIFSTGTRRKKASLLPPFESFWPFPISRET